MGETVLGNRYEIIKKIGDGGMAFVYKAKDILLNRIVAVKVLRPEFVDDDEFLGKFKREAEAVASLSHPNIVNVYDVGEDGKVHYIVMEYIDGQNLKEIIKNEGTLDEYTALDITKQIAMALSAAHKKGIIHRDIKPHNILISNEGRVVKVADFGIAKAVSNSTMTNIGSIIGSVHYFSPEQAKGKFVSNNADLYSLGIVLYEMIIGKVPFRGDSPISIALQHINDEIEFTSEEQINIPQSVRTFIPSILVFGLNTTTLATTGPANGPRPASSIPPIYKYPLVYPSFSYVFISSNRSSSFLILSNFFPILIAIF